MSTFINNLKVLDEHLVNYSVSLSEYFPALALSVDTSFFYGYRLCFTKRFAKVA